MLVGWVPPVKFVKKVKMVWACCWGGVMYYGENIGKGQIGLGVWLGCLVGTHSENCENGEIVKTVDTPSEHTFLQFSHFNLFKNFH